MSRPSEIERMFYEDVRDKKRTGSSIHSRKSTRRGGAGTIRDTKYNFKKYEKNSRVVKENIFETILPYKEFATYSEDMQREMLDEWVLRYTKKKIKNDMQISFNRLEKLAKHFDIEWEREVMKANGIDMDNYKKIGIDPIRFKLLPNHQKYEIVDFWQEERGMLNKDIAKLLGYNKNSFATSKSLWKKEYEKRKEEDDMTVYNEDFLFQESQKNQEEKLLDGAAKSVQEQTVVYKKDEDTAEQTAKTISGPINQGLLLEFEGIYTIDNLREKSEAIVFLMDEGKYYEVSVSIKEVKKARE